MRMWALSSELGDRQVWRAGERRALREHGTQSVAQEIPFLRAGTPLRHAVWKRERNGAAAIVFVSNRRASGSKRCAPLACSLAHAPQYLMIHVRRPLARLHHRDAVPKVGVRRTLVAPHRIAIVEERSNDTRRRTEAELPAAEQHVRKTRMCTQRRHGSSVRRDPKFPVESTQLTKQLARLTECRGRRKVHPAQDCRVEHASHRQIECERCEIRFENLGTRALEESPMLL
jgi:hypothetical protein